jgi:hypothetical protein
MSGSSLQFHKIWIEQCEATEGIREHFGLKNALNCEFAASLHELFRR